MFYLSNKKIKLFIISILLLIFCFILCIFDVKAEGLVWDSLYDVHDISMTYYDPAKDTTETDNFDINKVETYLFGDYLTFYRVIDPDYPLNEAPRHFSGIRANVENHETDILYYSYIIYSPTELDVHAICMYNPRPQSRCSNVWNTNDPNDPKLTTIQLNTEAGNYFYIISWKYQQYFRQNVTGYGIYWTNQDNDYLLVSPKTYTITGMYTFNTLSAQTQFVTDVSDILNNIEVDDPNINQDVDFNGIYASTIDDSNWSSTIQGWGHSFDSNASISTLITMPITLLTAILNQAKEGCAPFSIGNFYGTNLYFPCIDLSDYLGQQLIATIDLMVAGILIFKIGKKFVVIFNNFTNLRDNQIDELYGGGN